MAEEATRTPLDSLKDRLTETKKQRGIAKGDLSKAKQNLVEARRASREIIAAAKKKHAAAKMEACIREDRGRLERLRREGWGQSMLHLLLKVKIAYLERRLARTRQTIKRLQEGTGQLDESHQHIEDEQKDVENLLENREQQEQSAIKDVEEKRKELDALTDARNKKIAQAAQHIFGEVWENLRKKRQAVRTAASNVNSEALKFPWKRVADNTRRFCRWAGFAGVAGCFYASAVSLGAIFQFFYFHSNGVNIFSYAESVDFLAPGYALVAFFILTAVSGSLIPLAFYHFVKWIATRPLCAERVVGILQFFAKLIPKIWLFVLCCAVWLLFSLLLVAAGVRYIRSLSPDIVSIMTDPPIGTDSPFQQQKYVRVGSTSKYLFLKKFPEKDGAGGWSDFEQEKSSAPSYNGSARNHTDFAQTTQAKDSDGDGSLESETPDGKSDADILVVPLSQITCIGETTGNGEGLCRPAAVKSPPPAEDPVDQHIARDMPCRAGTRLVTSDFIPFVHNKGDEIAECAGKQPRTKEEWEEEIRRFVKDWNNKERKWRVYGLASLDGDSAENDDLSRQRAETVRDMMCSTSETLSSVEECEEEVEIRYLGENHLVTAGPKSRSAVIAVCERVPEQNPE